MTDGLENNKTESQAGSTSNASLDQATSEVLRKMAQERLESEKKLEMERQGMLEYDKALEAVLSDPTLQVDKEGLKEFVATHRLRRFGKEGFLEALELFNESLKSKANPRQDTSETIKGKSADPGESLGSVTGGQTKMSVLPKNEDGTINWLEVNLDNVEPSLRNEVKRRQVNQKMRTSKQKYGWK